MESVGAQKCAPTDILQRLKEAQHFCSCMTHTKSCVARKIKCCQEKAYTFLGGCDRLMAKRLGVPLVEQGLKQQQELKRKRCCVDWTGRLLFPTVCYRGPLYSMARTCTHGKAHPIT